MFIVAEIIFNSRTPSASEIILFYFILGLHVTTT